ncbi:MAG: threonine-phosphate decarboxylase [Deltaproteobacteria bacterium]|nr:threonine-phosphate decarboxylase [Deltaproteobacteria bacterium]
MDNKIEHKHGGNPKADFMKFGLEEKPVLDFSVNLNPLGPPEIVKSCWQDLFEAIKGYPSVEGEGIIHFYQNRFNLPYDNILAGNGSTELIYLIPRVLRLKKAMIFTPSFHDYTRASMIAGTRVTTYTLIEEDAFAFPDPRSIAEMIKDMDALWVGRPNNPTGTVISKDVIIELAKQFPEKWFIVDEAFIQFVEEWEKNTLLFEKSFSNILVLHSMTKYYALAGLRMGAVVAGRDVIGRLKAAKEPWTINGIADRVAPLLIDCKEYETRTALFVSQERDRVYHRLQGLDGVLPFLGTANYLLCQWNAIKNLDDLLRHLISNGIYIRDCRNFKGLEKNFFRFGLRSQEENDRLLHLLEGLV